MKARCQICGRAKGLLLNGTIRGHYVGGNPCPGAHALPIERDDQFLASHIEELERKSARYRAAIRRLEDKRANWIDPRLREEADRLSFEARRLMRRLTRHRAWPGRFLREMEKYGWGTPPPSYLLERVV